MRVRHLLLSVAAAVAFVGGAALAQTDKPAQCRELADFGSPQCAGLADTLTVAADPEAATDVTASAARVVDVVTDVSFVPNETLALNFHYDPGTIEVRHGKRVRWVQVGPLPDPHTVTLVDQVDLPSSLEELEACYDEGAPCSAALMAHDPDGPDGPAPLNPRVNVGERSFDQPGDSLWLDPPVGSRRGAEITAPAGTTLYYLCALHPWMQGRIDVK